MYADDGEMYMYSISGVCTVLMAIVDDDVSSGSWTMPSDVALRVAVGALGRDQSHAARVQQCSRR